MRCYCHRTSTFYPTLIIGLSIFTVIVVYDIEIAPVSRIVNISVLNCLYYRASGFINMYTVVEFTFSRCFKYFREKMINLLSFHIGHPKPLIPGESIKNPPKGKGYISEKW